MSFIRKFEHLITRHPEVARLARRLDRIEMRRKKVSLFRVVENLVMNVLSDDILSRASSVAFSFTLAVFPAIIFLITLIAYIPIPDLYNNIEVLIGELNMLEQVRETIHDVISSPRGDLLSFSVLLSAYLATNGTMELIQTFNKIYKTIESRNYFRTWSTAALLTVGLAVLLLTALSSLFIGKYLLDFLVENGFLQGDLVLFTLESLRFLIVFGIFMLAISLVYWFGPALHSRWPFISIGSVTATLLGLLVSYLFSSYITNFGTYNKLYGSIGAMIAFMFWMYMISVILLIGFEINASIDQAALQPPAFEPEDEDENLEIRED